MGLIIYGSEGGEGGTGEVPSLAQVLVKGRETLGRPIIITPGDEIVGLVSGGVTYPTAPGEDGQIMVIDGGVLSFENAPTGGGGDVVERLTENKDVLLTLASTTAEKQALIDAQPKYIDKGANLYFLFEDGVHDLGTGSLTIQGFHGGGRVGFNNFAKSSVHRQTDIVFSAKSATVTSSGSVTLLLRQNTCESRVYNIEVVNTNPGTETEKYYAVWAKDSINFKIWRSICRTTTDLAIPVCFSGVSGNFTNSHAVAENKLAPAIWCLDARMASDESNHVGLNAIDNRWSVVWIDQAPEFDLAPGGKEILNPLDPLALILSGSNDAEGQSIVGLNGVASEAGSGIRVDSDTRITLDSPEININGFGGAVNVLGNLFVGETAGSGEIGLEAQADLYLISEDTMSLDSTNALKINGMQWPDSGAFTDGYYLQIDENGVMSWQEVTGGGDIPNIEQVLIAGFDANLKSITNVQAISFAAAAQITRLNVLRLDNEATLTGPSFTIDTVLEGAPIIFGNPAAGAVTIKGGDQPAPGDEGDGGALNLQGGTAGGFIGDGGDVNISGGLSATQAGKVNIQGVQYPDALGGPGQVMTSDGSKLVFSDAISFDIPAGSTATEIQGIIDAAPEGSSLVFEQGTYAIDQNIFIDTPINLNGNGAILKSTADGIKIFHFKDINKTSNISNFRFESFQGEAAYNGARINNDIAVHVDDCANITVQVCSFIGFLDYALGVADKTGDKRQSSNKVLDNIFDKCFLGFTNWNDAEYGICSNNLFRKCRTAIMSCSGNFLISSNNVVDCRAAYVSHSFEGDHITDNGGNFAHGLTSSNVFNHCSEDGGSVWDRRDLEIGIGNFVDVQGVYINDVLPPTYSDNLQWYTPIFAEDLRSPFKVDMGKVANANISNTGTEPILLRDTDISTPPSGTDVQLIGNVEYDAWEEDFAVTFANTNARFFGELGNPEDQGWVNNATGLATIDLVDDVVNGVAQQVVRINDNTDTGIAETQQELTAQNWQDILDYGAVYSGTMRLDPVTGLLGAFSGVQTTRADNPLGNNTEQRYGFWLEADGDYIRLREQDGSESPTTQVTLDGTGGNPAIPKEGWFTFECLIPAGLGPATCYVNNQLTTFAPIFRINTAGNQTPAKVIISSGGTDAVQRVTYHANFGVTIFEEPAEKTIPVEMLGTDGSTVILPEGRRDYTLIFPDGAPQDAGDKVVFTYGNINGSIKLRTEDLDNPVSLFNGLRENMFPVYKKGTLVVTNTRDNDNIYTVPVDGLPVVLKRDNNAEQESIVNLSGLTVANGTGLIEGGLSIDDGTDYAGIVEGPSIVLGANTAETGVALGANGVAGIVIDKDCAERMIRLKDTGLDIETTTVPIDIRARGSRVEVRSDTQDVEIRGGSEVLLQSDVGGIRIESADGLFIETSADTGSGLIDIDCLGNFDLDVVGTLDILTGGDVLIKGGVAGTSTIDIGATNPANITVGTVAGSTVTIGTEDLGSGESDVQISGDIKIGSNGKSSFVDIQADDQVVIQAGTSVVLGTTEEIYIGQSDSALILIGDVRWPTGLPLEDQILIGNADGDLEWGTVPAGATPGIADVLRDGSNDAEGESIIGLNGITSVNGAPLNISSDTSMTLSSDAVTLSAGLGGINFFGDFTVGETAATPNIFLETQTDLSLFSEGTMSLESNGALTLNGTAWPAGGGGVDQVLISDGAGALAWGSNAASLLSLAQALANGQRTGGNDIFVEEGDKISGEPANQLGVDGTDLVLTGGSSIDAEEGSVIISGLKHPKVDGKAGDVLQTDGAGNLKLGAVVPTHYVNAYDTSTQTFPDAGVPVAIQFSDTSFNDGWQHVDGTAPFICPADGLYEVSLSGHILRDQAPSSNVFGMIAEVEGTQVTGSYFSIQPRTINSIYNFSHSFLVNINEGESLVVKAGASEEGISIVPAAAPIPVAVNPSVTIVIKRV